MGAWKTEQWKLQTETTRFTPEGYLYKISNAENKGYFLEPNIGQFNDGGRGDFAYLFATKQHLDRGAWYLLMVFMNGGRKMTASIHS